MVDLKLDTTHDLAVESFDLVLIDGSEQVAQHLKIRLWFFFAEWYLDNTKGVRYFEDVLVKNPNLPNIETLLKAEILGTEEVNQLLEFSTEYSASERTLSVSFKVDTDYGPVDVTDLNLGV